MKKIFLMLLLSSATYALQAQEVTDSTQAKTKIKVKSKDDNGGSSDDSKTKIKDNKAKSKDENGKIKVKNNEDMTNDNGSNSKTKIKDDKLKVKDEDGKLKVKTNGDMNSNMNSNGGTMNNGMANGGMNTTTTTTTTVITTGGWTTNPANLPVVGNNVSADVVANIKNKYGTNVYDIKQIKSTSGQVIYVVRVMDNGQMRTDYVGADGNTVSL